MNNWTVLKLVARSRPTSFFGLPIDSGTILFQASGIADNEKTLG